MTHRRRLRTVARGLPLFEERTESLRSTGKLGPILWQLPEAFRRNDERLAGALGALHGGRHAFEFRHESWFVPEVYALLREHGVALVISDHPKWPFQTMR